MPKVVRARGRGALQFAWLAPLTLLPFACGVSDVRERQGSSAAGGIAGMLEGGSVVGGELAGAGASAVWPTSGAGGEGGAAGDAVGGGFPDGEGGASFEGCETPAYDFWLKLVRSGAQCLYHRSAIENCEAPQDHGLDGPANGVAGAYSGPSALGGPCDSNADCSEIHLGYCEFSTLAGHPGECKHGCMSDAECEPDELCACVGGSSFAGRCIPTSCHSDAECGPNALCTMVQEKVCPHATSFACQTERDECQSRADCPLYPSGLGPAKQHEMCAFDGDHRACLNEVDPAIPENCF